MVLQLDTSGSDDVHGSVFPQDVRSSDRVEARVRASNSSAEYLPARVWSLSPLGIELVCESSHGSVLSIGASVALELIVAGQRSSHKALVVTSDRKAIRDGDICVVGMRLVQADPSPRAGNRRESTRWICSDRFYPTCMAPTPGRFDDYMYFQVRDVSSEGLQLVCSLRNKFLVPGMRLSLLLVLPLGNTIPLAVEVVRVAVVSEAGRDRLTVGVSYSEITHQSRVALGQYLLQFSNDLTADDLREAGFPVKSVASGVSFYNLRSEDDYKSVLRLRWLAHSRDGNIDESVAVENMGDSDDLKARIVVGKHDGKIVATARIRFNELHEPLEHEDSMDWPSHLPRRDQIVEVSRVATHPDYRRSDLLSALFRMCYLNMLQPERPWVVMSCLERMIPFYEKVGFKSLGITHEEKLWRDGKTLTVMAANTQSVALGRDVGPIVWNMLWREAAEVLLTSGGFELTGLDRARIRLYRLLGAFLPLFSRFRRLRRV